MFSLRHLGEAFDRWIPSIRGTAKPNRHCDFSTSALLSPLLGGDGHEARSDAWAEAEKAWRAGRVESAWTAFCAHFRERKEPPLFLDVEQVRRLVAEVGTRWPAWPERLVRRVQQDCHEGLSIYAETGPPLGADFDWRRLSPGPLDDKLYLVRPHRFGFVPRLTLAAHFGAPSLAVLADVVKRWMALAERPLPKNAARSSSLVVIYRLIALLWGLNFLRALGEEQRPVRDQVEESFWRIILSDAAYLMRSAGRSVPNNHLLADRFILWLIATHLPELAAADQLAHAEAEWVSELMRQTYDDGGSFEPSLHYQELGCEMALTYYVLARRNGWPISKAVEERIRAMLRFQACLADPTRVVPSFGDTTEDPLFPLGAGDGAQNGSLYEAYRSLFAPELRPADSPGRETAFWLLAGDLAPEGQAASPPVEAYAAFPQAGLYSFVDPALDAQLVLRSGLKQSVEHFGGHSHNDLLSLCLTVKGQSILASPGTYTYRFDRKAARRGRANYRHYLTGQASRSAPFLPELEPYGALSRDYQDWQLACFSDDRAQASCDAQLSWLEATITGASDYRGMTRGLVHVFGRFWTIYDILPQWTEETERSKAPQVGWQFAPEVTVLRHDHCGTFVEHRDGARLAILADGDFSGSDHVKGETYPPRGWVSTSYGRLDPAENLRFELSAGAVHAVFLLLPGQPASESLSLETQTVNDASFAVRLREGQDEHVLLINRGSSDTGIAIWDLYFEGSLLYFHRSAVGDWRIRGLCLKAFELVGERYYEAPRGLVLPGLEGVWSSGRFRIARAGHG